MTIWNPPRYAEDIVLRPYELFHDPPVDVSCFGTEVDPNAEYLAGVLCEREGVLLLLYLLQGLLGRAVGLELHYIHVVRSLHYHVDPAARGAVFHPGVESGESEYDEQHVLVVEFDVPCDFVRAVGEETLEPLHESVNVPLLHIIHEAFDFEPGLCHVAFGIIRHEESQEPLFDLPVGESEGVEAESSVVFLDCEVSALVDDRYGVVPGENGVKGLGVGLLAGHLLEVIVAFLEEFDEICRGSCLEPVAAVSAFCECVEEAEWVVYPRGVRAEVVSVIVLLQLGAGLFVCLTVVQGEGADVLIEVPEELLPAYTAYIGVSFIRRR